MLWVDCRSCRSDGNAEEGDCTVRVKEDEAYWRTNIMERVAHVHTALTRPELTQTCKVPCTSLANFSIDMGNTGIQVQQTRMTTPIHVLAICNHCIASS